MEERRLTNDEHFDLWETEYARWRKKQPSGRKKILLLLFFVLVAWIGIIMLALAVSMMIQANKKMADGGFCGTVYQAYGVCSDHLSGRSG